LRSHRPESGWSGMRARLALLVAATALVASGCGGSESRPFLIGLISDCYGPFGGAHELNLAAAELPLVERGAHPLARNPSAGISPVDVAGWRVQLRVGCAANTEDVIPAARQLVEETGVGAVVGGIDPTEGMALRQYARLRPDVAFLIQPSAAPELTLDRPAPNVFRFAPDAAQTSAGLGTYAFRRLGWRTAAIVGDDVPYGWEQAAGFIAEFCSLGGKVVRRVWGDPPKGIPRSGVDGYFMSEFLPDYLTAAVRAAGLDGDLGHRLLLGAASFSYAAQGALGDSARGVVGGSPVPLASSLRSWSRFGAQLKRAFPKLQASFFSAGYYTSVEAALRGLEAIRGDLSHGTASLMAVLAKLRFTAPTGPVRLNDHRQAIAPNYVVQIEPAGSRTLRTVAGVDDSYAGRFSPTQPLPGRTTPACSTGNPPAWAR
jgi:branched-chain amino acid transport system substrate-binding protein